MVDTLPDSFSPVFEIKLMIPPGASLAAVDAEPPRIDSTLCTVESKRMKMSALPKAISPNCITGKPSSCSCKNLAPPDATGKPRTAIFALPSPPVDSERTPGIVLKASAVERGVDTSISANVTLLTDELDAMMVVRRGTPVTTIVSRPLFLASGCACSSACKFWLTANASALNV